MGEKRAQFCSDFEDCSPATAGKTGRKWDFSPPISLRLLLPRRLLGACAAEQQHPFNHRHSRAPLAGIQRRMLWSANRRQESMGQKLKPPSVVISVDIDAKLKIQ
ncbi:hypothetical protein AAKU67_003857 [Oxalobacteraceae bacterium GrIS 2.11]